MLCVVPRQIARDTCVFKISSLTFALVISDAEFGAQSFDKISSCLFQTGPVSSGCCPHRERRCGSRCSTVVREKMERSMLCSWQIRDRAIVSSGMCRSGAEYLNDLGFVGSPGKKRNTLSSDALTRLRSHVVYLKVPHLMLPALPIDALFGKTTFV